jgi:hypothetical protein
MVGVAGLWGAALVLLAASTGLGAERFALRQPPPNDDNVVSPSDIVPRRAVPPADAVPYASDPYSAGPHVQKGWSCPPPCVKYHHHGRRACETYQTVVTYCDPCTGCTVQVPICVPVCCGGAPVVCERSGLFGRSIVVFQWCCGFKAKIIGDRCGNLTVHTYGR